MKVMYLISPYTHNDAKVMKKRVNTVRKIATNILDKYPNITLIEPVSTSVFHAKSLGHTYNFWKKRDRAFISVSSGVIISLMGGVELSTGAIDEVTHAKELEKEIFYYCLKNKKLYSQFEKIESRKSTDIKNKFNQAVLNSLKQPSTNLNFI